MQEKSRRVASMKLTKTSLLSGRTATRDVDLTEEELEAYYASDGLIQHMYPRLSPEDREFVMTGITPEEWHAFCAAESSSSDRE